MDALFNNFERSDFPDICGCVPFAHGEYEMNSNDTRHGTRPRDQVSHGHGWNNHNTCENCKKVEDNERKMKTDMQRKDNEIEKLRNKCDRLEKKSKEITECMADVFAKDSDTELLNDKYRNTNLAGFFRNEICNKMWADLNDAWESTPENEIDNINVVTTAMKEAYDECVQVAERQINLLQQVHLLENDSMDDKNNQNEIENLHKYCQTLGREMKMRERVVKNVFATVREKIKWPDDIGNMHQKFENFLKEFIESAWLMTTALPKLVLVFDVENKAYDKEKERFSEYSTQGKVWSGTVRKGSILAVVVPAVVKEKDGQILQKGEVITVDINETNIV